MSTGDDTRPDGRASTPETLRLRAATRALRLHLDELPIDYSDAVPPDRFLAGMAFMFARNRYACAESMIGAGFGGTVIGAIARSILTEGLRWLWIAKDPASRRRCILGDLLEERSRVAAVLDTDASTMTRWLMPVPPVADLTGASRSWLDADCLPGEDALLDEFLTIQYEGASSATDDDPSPFLKQAQELLDFAGLRGAAMVLAHAGHGNYLGQRSTLTQDGTPGFDLRADHEALFMHAAAVGVYCVLVGSSVATPDAWPHDVDRSDFLTAAAALTAEVAAAATSIHGLEAKTRTGGRATKPPRNRSPSLVRGSSLVENDDVRTEYVDIEDRFALLTLTFEAYVRRVKASPEITTLPADGTPLHAFLTYGAALSNLETVFSTYVQPGAGVLSVFAARALLEEAARLHWRYSVQGDEALMARAKQYFDEHRYRQRKTIRTLAGHGIKSADAARLFNLPSHVVTPPGVNDIAKNRLPVPSLASMLRSFSADAEKPGWLEAAYALLSQVTHATPLGHLHCLRYRDEWEPNELSSEMFALALDVTALGSAHLVSTMGLMLNDVSPAAQANVVPLRAGAVAVHLAARRIHGLDIADR
ncbi:hypothetical protein [Cellulomonas chitinilytica]|uniref:hypothetical protein n=1 Tax=Cellulomonas chitinilytica TaxID=398759 RepID=UPI001940C0D7|nr:hypothetical protein [Cellulomonas chitinilytica]